MAGNLREWTTESYDPDISESEEYNNENENSESKKSEYRVVRGGSANISKIANSRIGEKEDLSDTYWGFRIILYKE